MSSTLARQLDPIAALATASGRGAVGIVRASGADLKPLMQALCGRQLQPRHATLLPLRDAGGALIDHGLVLYFPAPQSYTGEDVLELQVHGGPALLELLLARLLQLGQASRLRLAEPGEFTRRAYLNGKLDLAQAEAVADLIDATTAAAVRGAARALDGELSSRVHALDAELRELRALVEATLDFPEEDIDFIRAAQVGSRVQGMRGRLDALLAQTRQGALLRDGLTIVLAGQPNVGKSSLLNALAGAELAIVTDIPGTTRDRVSQAIQIEGVPLHIVDTAGLRDATDQVERIGVQRSWEAVAGADALLFLHDIERLQHADYAQAERQVAAELAQRAGRGVPTVHVWNKVDSCSADIADARAAAFCRTQGWNADAEPLLLSARDGQGLDTLRRRLLQIGGWQAMPEGVFLARQRHVQALLDCARQLEQADRQLQTPVPALDLLAEDLRLAHQALMQICGEVTPDQLLGDIFSRFCIGK